MSYSPCSTPRVVFPVLYSQCYIPSVVLLYFHHSIGISLPFLPWQQEMQNMLQNVQISFNIYNSDIEPEHETEMYCSCAIHQYQYRKMARLGVQERWSKAVMYPGEYSTSAESTCWHTLYPFFNHQPLGTNPTLFKSQLLSTYIQPPSSINHLA